MKSELERKTLVQQSSNVLLKIAKNGTESAQALAVEALKADFNFYSSQEDDDLLVTEQRPCMPLGIEKLDKHFPFPTGYYVICANPGAGKGWFALWVSRKAFLKYQKKTVYFSLEMSEPLVRTRVLQQWSDLTQSQFESGMGVTKALQLLKKDVLVVDVFNVDDSKKQTPQEFTRLIEYYYLFGYRVFHFDHLHELDGANDNNRNQGVTELWAKTFQTLCKTYKDIWLFVYAQPNGAAANKSILKRTDIAGSKAITQKCEFFLSLNRSIKRDDNGEVVIDSENREVILWLDKSRVTSANHIGFKLYFSLTGNYESTMDLAEAKEVLQ